MPELPPPPPPPLSLAGVLVDAWRRRRRHPGGALGDGELGDAHPVGVLQRAVFVPLLAVACVVVAVMVGGWLVLQRVSSGASPPPEIELPRAAPSAGATDGIDGDPGTSTSPNTNKAGGPVTIHAAGAVTKPGVYRLPPGARVNDLLDAAGGATADAQVDALNLAALLEDGQRVYVPRRGELPPGASLSVGHDVLVDGRSPPSDRPLDLNTATLAQLDELPGVGPTTAQAIIDHRRRKGRFRSVDELLEVRGIGPARLETLRKKVRV